jgi:hypothetical protein
MLLKLTRHRAFGIIGPGASALLVTLDHVRAKREVLVLAVLNTGDLLPKMN